MPNRMEDKPKFVDPQPAKPTTGARRSQDDPGGFMGRTLAGRYAIEEFHGMGGMAYVYRAKDLRIARTVAVKILKPDLVYADRRMVEEFLNEAKATANLSHRNIIEVSDADRDEDGTTFLVMQFLKGKPLDEVIANDHPLPLERVANLFEQICDGVRHAHANGIIHRDLKPGNIMVMADGHGDEVVKILDFGIAKAMTATAKVSREIGTIYYASPEQLTKGSGIDARSDIYSLGVMLYQLLTGAVPFDDDSVEHIIYQKLNFAPPLLRHLRAEIPAPVEEVVGRTLAKDPANRYQDATEVSRAFWRAISLETGVLVIDCVDAATRGSLTGASVLVNGKHAGQTDARGHWRQSGMLPRQYLIEIESPGFQNRRASIRVEPGEELTITVEMQPEPKGDLIVACGVAGAQLELDERKAGAADENGRLFLEAVNAGKHQVRLSHPRYQPAEAEVEVGIGDQAFLDIALAPKSISWWQKPLIVGSTAAALALAGLLVWWMNSRQIHPGKDDSLVLLTSPTPEITATPSPDTSPSPAAETSPTLLPAALPSSSPKSLPSPSPKSSSISSPTVAPTAAPTVVSTIVVPTIDGGLIALRNKRYQESVNILRQFPKDPRALKGLADAYLGLNQSQNAVLMLEEVLKLEPGSTDILSRLGDLYLSLGSYDKAVERYRQLLNWQPDNPSINYKLCRAYFNLGDSDNAVHKCGHAIVKKPDYEEAYKIIDQAYQKLKGVNGNEAAKDFYMKQRTKNDNNPLPIYYQGLAYVRMKKKGDAEKHVKLLEKLGSPLVEQLKAAIK